ncbi:hypothetical protein HG531_004175 [Fusarium graminearum]|nr:hypothetical protein HG531_004175 [Fusarium graminearum]
MCLFLAVLLRSSERLHSRDKVLNGNLTEVILFNENQNAFESLVLKSLAMSTEDLEKKAIEHIVQSNQGVLNQVSTEYRKLPTGNWELGFKESQRAQVD